MQWQLKVDGHREGPVASEVTPLIEYAVYQGLARWEGCGGTMRVDWNEGVEIARVE